MDEPSHSLPLDTSLTRLESSVPISDSSCVRHPRRSSCEYEYKGPVGQFIMDPQGHSSVYSYTTTSWSEMFGSSTARDAYGQNTRYDPEFGPQVMSNRSRLGNKTSKSLDLDCSLTQSVMLPRRQSLDETFHQTASSKNPGPFRGHNGSFQRSTQSCVADQTLVHKEHASRSATYGSRGNSQETFGLSTCMFPETQTSAPHPNTEPLKHQSRQKLHHHRHLTTGGEFTRTYPYPYLDIKTEPVDPPGTSQSQYSEQSGRVEPLVNLPEGFYNSTYGSDNTYDALYKQASRSEGGQMYGFQKGRKSKTRHPLLPSTSKEDSEDTTNIFSASAGDRALLIG
ncbi:uncharacterized protein LOC134276500 [Saccostrea cucullata]|uniref:uncharacterized protein LOC134276500 n=1 Tax=Saccostrea cuccullata TaxID=36930 RepID=UPI002ED47794